MGEFLRFDYSIFPEHSLENPFFPAKTKGILKIGVENFLEHRVRQRFGLKVRENSEFSRFGAIVRIVRSREHNDYDFALEFFGKFVVFFQEFPAVHSGHIDIQKDQIGAWIGSRGPFQEILESGFAGLFRDYLVGEISLSNDSFVNEVIGMIVIDEKDTIYFLIHIVRLGIVK